MPPKAQFFLTNFLTPASNFPSKRKTFFFPASPEVFESDCLSSAMKKAGLFAASVVAASASAVSNSSSLSPSSSNFTSKSNFQFSSEDKKEHENSEIKKSASTEKFAPTFDGLRFIETLVTAHR